MRAIVCFTILTTFFSNGLLAQMRQNSELELPYIHLLKRHLRPSEIFVPEKSLMKKHTHRKTDWAQMIDNTWGPGLPTSEKLELFDRAWRMLDEGYGAFVNRDVDMIALKNLYRPMIEAGVSRGKFAAIMNHLSMAMQDAHTFITNIPVTWGTFPQPGIPLFVVSAAWSNTRFGATLTVLPDSSLLVIKVTPDHVLGLEPGDIVLGYDGVLWVDLYQELIDAMLPISMNYVFGSTEASMTDVLLRSAGLNWHLFDTIDILKYATGETVHLPTSLLLDQRGMIWGNEQLEIPGIPQPDFPGTDHITWGVIDGINIGYIYAGSWEWREGYHVSEDFYDAVYNLQVLNNTDGLIIDMRLNYGGSMLEAHAGYGLLFNETFNRIGFDVRNHPDDHLSMRSAPTHPSSYFVLRGNPDTFYDRPIAVLTGPGAVSNGDWESIRLGWHPMARIFGKPTNGAFTISDYPDLHNQDWFFYRSTGSGYLYPDHTYMAHRSAPIDEEVWFTPDDVAHGRDTVVERAVEWINSLIVNYPAEFSVDGNYPNPFNQSTMIRCSLPQYSRVSIKIYNLLGQRIKTLIDGYRNPGVITALWDGTDDSGKGVYSGVYFYRISTDGVTQTKKMTFLK